MKMRAHKISNDSNLTLEEKLKVITDYELDDVRYALMRYKEDPDNFEKEIKWGKTWNIPLKMYGESLTINFRGLLH